MNNNRFCTQKGHNKAQVTHLCLYEDCKLKNQQCCRLCITQGIHQHGQSDNEHIHLKQEIQNNQQMLPQLDKQDDKYKNIKSIDFKNRKYNHKQIGHEDNCFTAAISNDEKYLAYGGENIFKIFDLKEDKIIKEIKGQEIFTICQFTQDSSQLFVAYGSFLIGYDVKMNFKNTFQYIILAFSIDDIITIQNKYLMILGENKDKIVKIDIKRKKKLFILQNYDQITGIDYDQNNNFLINGSEDGSIKLWHCGKLKIIIKKQQTHPDEICQIQFINNIQNVISLDYSGNLYKWRIDLINKQLIKLEEYESSHTIWSFQQINQNQNWLLICQDCIILLDDKGKFIIKIDHYIDHDILDKFSRMKIRQLDNVRYIIIASQSISLLQKRINHIGFSSELKLIKRMISLNKGFYLYCLYSFFQINLVLRQYLQ